MARKCKARLNILDSITSSLCPHHHLIASASLYSYHFLISSPCSRVTHPSSTVLFRQLIKASSHISCYICLKSSMRSSLSISRILTTLSKKTACTYFSWWGSFFLSLCPRCFCRAHCQQDCYYQCLNNHPCLLGHNLLPLPHHSFLVNTG
jgi:hypothetical protein